MKERAIIFSGPMVRAILEGRKTQTRRLVISAPLGAKWVSHSNDKSVWFWSLDGFALAEGPGFKCPYGVPGDRLWVRESLELDGLLWRYKADQATVLVDPEDKSAMVAWAHHKKQGYCPSIHMPKWASRIALEVVGVRVERLQSISEEDAIAEGVRKAFAYSIDTLDGEQGYTTYRAGFIGVWKSIHGEEAWIANPWVWAIEFKRVEP